MDPIVLKRYTKTGIPLEAIFLPEQGMSLISYKRNGIEVIAPSSARLIGPHFGSRKVFPDIKEDGLRAHVDEMRAKGFSDPFPNGIGRYVPWQTTFSETKTHAILSSKDNWQGTPLSALDGQNFKMELKAELMPNGLEMEISSVSDADSLVGFQYNFHLPNGQGKITSKLQNRPLSYDLDRSKEISGIFNPSENPREGKILLETTLYRLMTTTLCCCQENCWQLFYPVDASSVCIAPMSAQDPYHPNLTVSSIRIKLQILGEKNDE